MRKSPLLNLTEKTRLKFSENNIASSNNKEEEDKCRSFLNSILNDLLIEHLLRKNEKCALPL